MKTNNFLKILILISLIKSDFNYASPLKLYVNSIAKSGTFLMVRCIRQILRKQPINIKADLSKFHNEKELINSIKKNYDPSFNWDKNWIFWHSKFCKRTLRFLKSNNFTGIFIYRDPRDRLISAAHWVIQHKELWSMIGYKPNDKLILSEVIKRMILINHQTYREFLPWKKARIFCSVRFEDLIGPKGGGSLSRQYQTIQKICNHLKINRNYSEIKQCANSIFGTGATFRKGQIGSWKKYFTREHKQLFKKISGRLLIELGYEKDFNW